MLLVQDIDSHSMLVRYYYQHRIFMGFCCVSVEVLYLLVSASSICEGLYLLTACLDCQPPLDFLQIFLAGNNRFRGAYRVHLPLPKQTAVQICQHVPGQPRMQRFV